MNKLTLKGLFDTCAVVAFTFGLVIFSGSGAVSEERLGATFLLIGTVFIVGAAIMKIIETSTSNLIEKISQLAAKNIDGTDE